MSDPMLVSTQPGTGAASKDAAVRTLIAVADQFCEAGFDVRSPAWGDTSYLRLTNVRGARCELSIAPSGAVVWDYHVGRTRPGDHIYITGVILALLAPTEHLGTLQAAPWDADLTLKGLVGRELADHGMHVTLQVVDADNYRFEPYAELGVYNPARPERGTIRFSDEGAMWWECRIHDPAHHTSGLTMTDITDAVITALTATTQLDATAVGLAPAC